MPPNMQQRIQTAIQTGQFDGWEKWPPEAQVMLRDELKRAVDALGVKAPQTDDELKLLVRDSCGIIIPDTQVCDGHATPFRAFSDAFFARSPVTVWKASRGFGGKSFLLALLGHVEAFVLGAEVAILGGSGEQSLKVMSYLQKFTGGGEQVSTQRQSLYGSGGKIRAQMASSTSVRGPHQPRLRLDECLARGTPVATPLGWRDIATLSAGDVVYSLYEGRIVINRVNRIWNRGWRPVLRCEVAGRFAFHATPEHPVLSSSGWRVSEEATDIQTVPELWGADSQGQKQAEKQVYKVPSSGSGYIGHSSLFSMRRLQGVRLKNLPQVPLCEQGEKSKPLSGLQKATSLHEYEALPPLPSQMDEWSGRGEVCSGQSEGPWCGDAQQGGRSNGPTARSSKDSLPTAGSHFALDRRFRHQAHRDRGSRQLLARQTLGQDSRPEQTNSVRADGLSSDLLPHRSNALLVARPFRTYRQELVAEVFDISTDSGAFIAWPGVVVHNCDEMELDILNAAMGQPMGTAKIPKQTVMSSTHHYPDATFSEILRRAEENGWPVYEWCYHESSAHPDGWLAIDEILSKQKEVTAAMWSAEYDLQEPSPEDRAILPDKIDACFDKSLGEYVGRLGERIEIEQPDPAARYATGCDWAKKKDFTVIDTLRIDVKPFRRVAWQRTGRLPWPMMIARFEAQVKRYPGRSAHDATGLGDVVEDYQGAGAEPVVLTGQTRSDVFTKYIAAIENGAIVSPKIRHCENEHRYCTNDDLRGSGHPPDSFIAGAMAYRAATKREPAADETYSYSYVDY